MVDLRGNSGGETQGSADMQGLFVGAGEELLRIVQRQGDLVYVGGLAQATEKPLILLQDGLSASASESFAATMRDYERALIVGTHSFGKGSAQTVFQGGEEGFRLTTGLFYGPGGSTVNQVGVYPHLFISGIDADEVALLLTASAPSAGESAGYLRLALAGSHYYIDTAALATEKERAYLTSILEAISPMTELAAGSEAGFVPVAPEDVAEEMGLSFTARRFDDVDSSPYADELNTLHTYGVVFGDGEGSFDPNANFTRVEFAALLAQAFALRVVDVDSGFTDVASDAWYGEVVDAVVANGLMEGVGEGQFAPDAPVTRQELVTIVGRTAAQWNLTAADMLAGYRDTASVPGYADWAVSYLALLQEMQSDEAAVFWQDPAVAHGAEVVTREEAATLVYHLLVSMGMLNP